MVVVTTPKMVKNVTFILPEKFLLDQLKLLKNKLNSG
jgi:hypothetical protein